MEVADPLERIQCLHLQTGKPQLEDHLGNVDLALGDEIQTPTPPHCSFEMSSGKAHILTKSCVKNEDVLVQHPSKCSLNQLLVEPNKRNHSK
jgi:hypothetical protein